jgi:uncharacterized protein
MLTVVLAVGVGLSLGLLGGGGSILAVPLLVYVAGLPAKEAIAMSLLVVGATSAAGLVPHARAGRVRWRTGLLFGVAAMGGAYGGGRLAAVIPATVLLIGFAVMMFATAIAMIGGRRVRDDRLPAGDLPVARVVTFGFLVGSVAGLVGAGGGFLVVPALALLGGLAMPAAIATSLLVIALQSLAGFAGHLATTTLHWGLAAAVTAAAVAGALIGARVAGRVRPEVLRRAFGWFVMAMAIFVLIQQVPADQRANPLLWTGIAAGASTVALVALVAVRRRRTPPPRAEAGASITATGSQYPLAYHGHQSGTKGK